MREKVRREKSLKLAANRRRDGFAYRAEAEVVDDDLRQGQLGSWGPRKGDSLLCWCPDLWNRVPISIEVMTEAIHPNRPLLQVSSLEDVARSSLDKPALPVSEQHR
jgi:hypothetical protein